MSFEVFKSRLNEELPVWDIFLSAGTLGTSGDKKDMFPHHTPEYMDSVKNGEGPQTLKNIPKSTSEIFKPQTKSHFQCKREIHGSLSFLLPSHIYGFYQIRTESKYKMLTKSTALRKQVIKFYCL